MSAALPRMLELFKNHAARAFSHNEAVAIAVIGTRGFFRPVVEGRRKSATGGETGKPQAIDRRFGAARHHHIGVAQSDESASVADRMRPRRAGGDDRMIWAFELVGDRDIAAGQVDK